MKSEVTVLIPSYNPGRYLREAVESVFNQTMKNWELIIVDDASTDDSLSTIKDYMDDPRITIIRNPINMGQSKTQNVGLQYVKTPFFIMLDSDDWFFPDTLKTLMKESKNVSDDVALICGNVRRVYEDDSGKVIKEYVRKSENFESIYEYILSTNVPYPRFYRTAALKYIGGWPTDDPYEGRYLEDQRIDLRLLEHFKILWINKTLYNYRRHGSNMSENIQLMNEMIEWTVKDSLKRNGDKYNPVFEYRSGWLCVKDLNPKK